MAKVSIVVPCYNKEAYIGRMLESVYRQKWPNVELLFINDGSTDETRRIIANWEDRFINKGYEFRLIDHEQNMGVAQALKTGLQAMKGDYFCTVDCDDRIAPEYLSVMADFLDSNADYMMTVCRTNRSHWDYERNEGQKKVSLAKRDEAEPLCASSKLLESYIFHRTPSSLCLWMIRVSYIDCLDLRNKFETRYRYTQEPQLAIPLLAGGGRIKYIPQPLYFYEIHDIGITAYVKADYTAMQRHIQARKAITHDILAGLSCGEEEKRRLQYFADIGGEIECYNQKDSFSVFSNKKNDIAERCALAGNAAFVPDTMVSAEKIVEVGFLPFFRAAGNAATEYHNDWVDFMPSKENRIIAYGALGKKAADMLECLKGTPLEPSVLWDKAATGNEYFHGCLVETPKVSQLSEGDIVLSLVKNNIQAAEIWELLEKSRAGERLYYLDVLDWLAGYYFPELV